MTGAKSEQTLQLLLELLLTCGVEGSKRNALARAFNVHSADIVVHDDRELVPHRPGLAVHELVQVRPNHQIYARLIE